MKLTTTTLTYYVPQVIEVPTDNTSVAVAILESDDDADIGFAVSLDGVSYVDAVVTSSTGNPCSDGVGSIYAGSIGAFSVVVAGYGYLELTNRTYGASVDATVSTTSAVSISQQSQVASAQGSTPALEKWAWYGVSGSEQLSVQFLDASGGVISEETIDYSGDPTSIMCTYSPAGDGFPAGAVGARARLSAGTMAYLNLDGASVEELGGVTAWAAAMGLAGIISPDDDPTAWPIFIGQEFTFALDANGDLVRREKSWGCIALLGLAGTTVACELIDASGRQVLEATLSTGITTAKSLASHVRANTTLSNDNAMAVHTVRLRVTAGTLYLSQAGNPDPTATASNGISGTATSSSSAVAITVGGMYEWSEK